MECDTHVFLQDLPGGHRLACGAARLCGAVNKYQGCQAAAHVTDRRWLSRHLGIGCSSFPLEPGPPWCRSFRRQQVTTVWVGSAAAVAWWARHLATRPPPCARRHVLLDA